MIIRDLLNSLGSHLVSNSGWIDQIRTVGYFRKIQDENGTAFTVTDSDINDIGITDTQGNSGYIRFRQDTNIQSQEIRSLATGERAFKYSVPCRIVVLGKDIDELAALGGLMTMINRYNASPIQGVNNILFTARGGSSHSEQVHASETGKEQNNPTYRTIMVDFDLTLEDYTGCAFTVNENSMNSCFCQNILDLGCVGHCDDITIDAQAGEGNAFVITNFNGSRVEFAIETTEGEDFSFNAENLNADYTFVFEIVENGEPVTVTVDGTEYDCFRVKIEP